MDGRPHKYILNRDGEPEETDDLIEWALWLETADLVVKQTRVGPLTVSTVFIGLDHQFGDGPPLIYETMIFGSEPREAVFMHRYSTRNEALRGHTFACAMARRDLRAGKYTRDTQQETRKRGTP